LENPDYSNDIQKVDIVVSQHWMRSLAWKLSIQSGYVMLNSKREMNVTYPLEIAQDALGGLSKFSPEAFEVHGPGMEVKIYEIANVLADSILCKPEEQSSLLVGPRETLQCLAGILFSFQVNNPDLRSKLSSKLDVILGRSMVPRGIDAAGKVNEFECDENGFSPSLFLPVPDEFLVFA
jgi:hypothetical protein